MTARVIGLDLSLSATGIALHDGSSRTIKPQAGSDDNVRRLHQLVTRIDSYIKADQPDLVVIESTFVGRNRRTSMLLAGLGWCVRQRVFEMAIPYADVENGQLKEYATGDGKASKDDMVFAARQAGFTPANDNEADAVWLHAMGRSEFSETWEPAYRCVELLEVRAQVRRSIRWPAVEVARG